MTEYLNTRGGRKTGLKPIEIWVWSPTVEGLRQRRAQSLNIKVGGFRAQCKPALPDKIGMMLFGIGQHESFYVWRGRGPQVPSTMLVSITQQIQIITNAEQKVQIGHCLEIWDKTLPGKFASGQLVESKDKGYLMLPTTNVYGAILTYAQCHCDHIGGLGTCRIWALSERIYH